MLTRLTLAVGAVGASLAFAPALTATAAAKTSTPTEYVATTGSNTNANGSDNTCRLSSNPCLTIQHAISDAPATGTIDVAAGTYPEQLTINGKNLTIVGNGETTTKIEPTSLPTSTTDPNNSGGTTEGIVAFENTSSGGLENITVNGSGYTDDSGCGDNHVGVYFYDASGKLTGDKVTDVQQSSDTNGSQNPNGDIYVANDGSGTAGATAAVTIDNVTANEYTKNGITCENTGTTCTIDDTTVTGAGPVGFTAQNGIVFEDTSGGKVENSTVEKNTYTNPNYPTTQAYTASGILVYDSGTASITGDTTESNDENIVGYEDGSGPTQGVWTITGNTASQATSDTGQGGATPVPLGNGIGDGIDLYGTTTTNVYSNTVNENPEWGIALYGVTNSKIGASGKANIVTDNGDDGIYLAEFSSTQPSAGNTVAYNNSSDNTDDGILVAGPDSGGNAQATNNLFSTNTLQNNVRYDAEDLTTGASTAGTADTWKSNGCTPAADSNPTGLCAK